MGLPEATGSESPPRGYGASHRVRVRPGLQQLHSWLNRRLCLGRNCENLQTSLFERAANALMCVTMFSFLFVRKGGSPNSSFLFQFCKSVVVSETKVGYVSDVKWYKMEGLLKKFGSKMWIVWRKRYQELQAQMFIFSSLIVTSAIDAHKVKGKRMFFLLEVEFSFFRPVNGKCERLQIYPLLLLYRYSQKFTVKKFSRHLSCLTCVFMNGGMGVRGGLSPWISKFCILLLRF